MNEYCPTSYLITGMFIGIVISVIIIALLVFKKVPKKTEYCVSNNVIYAKVICEECGNTISKSYPGDVIMLYWKCDQCGHTTVVDDKFADVVVTYEDVALSKISKGSGEVEDD